MTLKIFQRNIPSMEKIGIEFNQVSRGYKSYSKVGSAMGK
jgi:hypothetical protein